jgi:putative ABC transport system substrate-binding protein
MITRRTLLASGAIFAAIPSVAQPKEGPFRAGLQWAGQALTPENSPWMQAFTEELERLGYVGGKNLEFETRTAGGDTKRLPDLAAELLALRPDVILVSTTASLMALANQHATVPVVFTIGVDPIGLGIVQSLAHPGGYFTGLFNNAGDVLPRSLQMLRDLLPQARRVGSLIDPSFGPKITAEFLEHMNAAADRLGFEFKAIEVTSPEQLPSVFDQLEKFKAEAFFFGHGRPIVEPTSAGNHRIATCPPIAIDPCFSR